MSLFICSISYEHLTFLYISTYNKFHIHKYIVTYNKFSSSRYKLNNNYKNIYIAQIHYLYLKNDCSNDIHMNISKIYLQIKEKIHLFQK